MIIENTSLMQQDKYIYFTYMRSLHVSGEISPIIRSYKTVHIRSSCYTVTLDFSQRALHLRRARNIDAPASILFPRQHLFGLLWEPLPYLNVYSTVTPDGG